MMRIIKHGEMKGDTAECGYCGCVFMYTKDEVNKIYNVTDSFDRKSVSAWYKKTTMCPECKFEIALEATR